MNQKKGIWLCYFIVTGLLLIFSNSCKKANDTPVEKMAADNVTDKDGNIYSTVTIGNQIWLAENLMTTKYSNGDVIPTTTLDISREATPRYQWSYGDDSTKIATYGRLYTWYTVIDSRNICPTGWHVPSDAEWETLKSNFGIDSIAGGKFKESGTTHWLAPNSGATNETGFTALPGGYRTFNGVYVGITLSSWLWSASDDSPLGWGQCLHHDDVIFRRWGFNKSAGVSVRCIKNI
jgi:uncharacterized protein (TIGR02145 family)